MMDKKLWKDKFVKWFEEEIANSDKPLDEHWDVEVEEIEDEILIKATSPKTPYSVYVHISKGFASLQIYTGIETAVMEIKERLKIYRTLLLLNGRWRMAKYIIGGDNDEIIINTDLDLVSLSREEFSDALTATLFALNDMVERLGFSEDYMVKWVSHLLQIVEEKLEEESEREVEEYLMKTFGMTKEMAKEIIRTVKAGDEGPSLMYR
ncbi:MAG TPA: hypothetical protein ENL42_01990 [Thermoplasmatales archaeon]|nr:hypothetical protein [Thermoplasmatales archaeon]